MVLAKGQTWRSIEQNREFKNRPTDILSVIFHKSGNAIQRIKDGLFDKWYWNDYTSIGQKEKKKVRTERKRRERTSLYLPHLVVYSKLKMDHRSKYKTLDYITSRRKKFL